MDVVEILPTIPSGSIRSYTWVAEQLGWGRAGARPAGRAIAKETLRRWPTCQQEDRADDRDSFPWWRVVGINGEVRTISEDHGWFVRQVERLESEGHRFSANGLRVDPLPPDFE